MSYWPPRDLGELLDVVQTALAALALVVGFRAYFFWSASLRVRQTLNQVIQVRLGDEGGRFAKDDIG